MSSIKKKWHLALSVNDEQSPIVLHLNEKIAIGIVITVILTLFAFTGTSLYFVKNAVDKNEFSKVEKENNLLQNELNNMQVTVDSMSAKMKLMQSWENEMRSEKKLKQISDEIRNMGQGGIPKVDTLFKSSEKKLQSKINLLRQKISILQKRVDFNFTTHEELKDHITLSHNFYKNTPSIYPVFGRLTCKYGFRRHPITGKRDFHRGLDFGNSRGTPIYATADGEIKKVGRLRLFGIYVYISHNYGYETRYAHLQKFIVHKGDKVKKGQIIGYLGNTGKSSGPHLHYEILRFGKSVNPYYYLNKKEEDIKVALK